MASTCMISSSLPKPKPNSINNCSLKPHIVIRNDNYTTALMLRISSPISRGFKTVNFAYETCFSFLLLVISENKELYFIFQGWYWVPCFVRCAQMGPQEQGVMRVSYKRHFRFLHWIATWEWRRKCKICSLHFQYIITLFEDKLIDCWLDMFRKQPCNSAKQLNTEGHNNKSKRFVGWTILTWQECFPVFCWYCMRCLLVRYNYGISGRKNGWLFREINLSWASDDEIMTEKCWLPHFFVVTLWLCCSCCYCCNDIVS